MNTRLIELLEVRQLLTAVTPDPAFGSGGSVATDFGGNADSPDAIAVQADGKVLVLGNNFASELFPTIVRYTAAGVLDTTFGTGGKVDLPSPLDAQVYDVAATSAGILITASGNGVVV